MVVTGAAGEVGRSVAAALKERYRVVGLDVPGACSDLSLIPIDLTADISVTRALDQLRDTCGAHLAGVVHLAEHRDLGGADDPRYRTLNVDGTRRLLDRLQRFRVDRFVLASTMFVERPGSPGAAIDEDRPLGPHGAYSTSKAAAEQTVRERHRAILYAILRVAWLYDDETVPPPLAHRIAHIRERTLASHLHAGDPAVRQAALHRDDLADAIVKLVDRRAALPDDLVLLLGEPDPPSVADLQDAIGEALHGQQWRTLRVPAPAVTAAEWIENNVRSHLAKALGDVERPPPLRTTGVADDDYALDFGRAATLLDWTPRRRLKATLPTALRSLKRDPQAWYAANGLPWPGAGDTPAGT